MYGRIAGGGGHQRQFGSEIGAGSFRYCLLAFHVFGCRVLQLHCLLVILSIFSWFNKHFFCLFLCLSHVAIVLYRWCVYISGLISYLISSIVLIDENCSLGIWCFQFSTNIVLILVSLCPFLCRWRIIGWQLSFWHFCEALLRVEIDGNGCST